MHAHKILASPYIRTWLYGEENTVCSISTLQTPPQVWHFLHSVCMLAELEPRIIDCSRFGWQIEMTLASIRYDTVYAQVASDLMSEAPTVPFWSHDDSSTCYQAFNAVYVSKLVLNESKFETAWKTLCKQGQWQWQCNDCKTSVSRSTKQLLSARKCSNKTVFRFSRPVESSLNLCKSNRFLSMPNRPPQYQAWFNLSQCIIYHLQGSRRTH